MHSYDDMAFRCFRDDNELLSFARWFVQTRLRSLENDVNCCLSPTAPLQPAPFPALLYCLPHIDLFGVLLRGKKGPTEDNFKEFLTPVGYGESTQLLVRWFRHKLAHQAQPIHLFKQDNEWAGWKIDNEDNPFHMEIRDLREPRGIGVYPAELTLPTFLQDKMITKEMIVSVPRLLEDIKKAAGEYLEQLDTKDDRSI